MLIVMLLRNQTISLITFLVLILASAPASAQEECKGSARQVHRYSNYHFVTTSRVYHSDGVEFYETCVENHSNRDLWFDWFVPGPNSYVLPGTAINSPRTFTTRNTIGLNGCLQYGNLSETIKEQFLGHVTDKPQIEQEQKKGCVFWEKTSSPKPSRTKEIQKVSVAVRIFFPSDRTQAAATMLVLQGEASVVEIDETGYTSEFKYAIKPAFLRSKGDARKIRIKPVDTGPAGDFLRKFFTKRYIEYGEKGFLLGTSDLIRIRLMRPLKPVLDSTRYSLFDQNNNFLGAVFIPIWAPVAE